MIALDRLQTIIPQDQALANKALATSLQQIGGINNMTLKQLSVTALNAETNKDLPLVNLLEQPSPPEVTQYFYNTLGQNGTGPNNTYVLTDVLGLITGDGYTEQFASIVATMATMDLSELTLDFQTMLEVVQGTYGTTTVTIPVGKPAAGTYPSRDSAISTGLIPATDTTLTTIIAAYPQQVQQLNDAWSSITSNIANERLVQEQVGITFTAEANVQPIIYAFATSAQMIYGLNTQAQMSAWYLESVATMDNIYGQSLVALMRLGRNDVTINGSGVTQSSNVSTRPVVPYPRAELMPAYYTPEEAASIILK